ncbi:MAG: helix-turn-helix transcriptional regulator, partial [Pseudomonadota bacterium]|nr:helix-turn-helix transcriptional regulator [Pseudomonadota bacterium]
DAIARAEERDPAAARALLEEQIRPAVPIAEDWPDVLARDLLSDPNRHLDAWADQHGLAPETISRRFSKVFGVTPTSFRLEARTKHALDRIVHSAMPLAAVAAAAGFSDQAHMSRAIRALTGRPPNAWRRSNPFKTAEAGAS